MCNQLKEESNTRAKEAKLIKRIEGLKNHFKKIQQPRVLSPSVQKLPPIKELLDQHQSCGPRCPVTSAGDTSDDSHIKSKYRKKSLSKRRFQTRNSSSSEANKEAIIQKEKT